MQMDYPNTFSESETYYLQLLENLRHQEVPALQFTNLVFRFCDGKFPFTEDHLFRLASLATEKLISESPLKEILFSFDTIEFRDQLIKHQFNHERFFIFCRYLCRTDKQGFDILGFVFFKEPWQHNHYFQLAFIKYCIDTNNVDEILSKCTPERNAYLLALVPQIELLKSQPDFEKDKTLHTWKYQCIYRIITALSEVVTLQSICEEILFTPLNKCPDLLVLGLLEVEPQQQGLKGLLLLKAIIKFIDPTHPNPSQANATQIFQKLWPSDFNQTSVAALSWSQRVLIQAMIELYTTSPPGELQAQKLKQILDLSQDLKALNFLLSTTSYLFVIDLACLASRREYLKLDKWLNDKIAKHGQPFINACVGFLQLRCAHFGGKEHTGSGYPVEIYRIILESLKQCISFESPKNQSEEKIANMYKAFVQYQMAGAGFVNQMKPSQFDAVYQQQMAQAAASQGQLFNQQGRGGAAAAAAAPAATMNAMATNFVDNIQNFVPDADVVFAKDVEDEADSYFQKIYNQDQTGSMSIEQVLVMLGKFRESKNSKERDIFRCMIRNLFKEFPFLVQYPDKELMITGELFGGIINNDYLKCFPLIGGLRMMLDALKKPPNARIFNFATTALDRFKARLKDFPQFCQHITTVPHFNEFPPELIRYIEYGQNAIDPPEGGAQALNGLAPASTAAGKKNQAMAPKDLGPLAEVSPPNTFQDKISFIINNLSKINMNKKTEEFKELVMKEKEIYRNWVAHYFVMKRVSIEANFHDLYASFLFSLDMSTLSQLVLEETYRNIRSLLRAYRDADNLNDRTVLKNLGHWLGMITLEQNKPILSSQLDLHGLLVEAYVKGLLHLYYVVPFVAKVLNGVAKSKVFRPPNPWTVSLISILVNLHDSGDVKLNLKFEVEVLCKYLDIELKDYRGRAEWLLTLKELPKHVEPMLGNFITVSHPQIGGASVVAETLASETPTSSTMTDSSSAKLNRAEPPVSPAFDLANVVAQGATMLASSSSPITANGVASIIGPVHNFNDMSPNYLLRSLVISSNLPDQVKDILKQCFHSVVIDFANNIVDRVVKVSFTSIETLIKKDFPLESNAELMRLAARNLMRSLAASYALILTKEPLINRLVTQLVQTLSNATKSADQRDIEALANVIVNENIDLGVCLVEKMCIERGLLTLENRMKSEFEQRQRSGYAETILAAHATQIEAHPENLRHRFGVISSKQMAIYEELGRILPGFVSHSLPAFPLERINATGMAMRSAAAPPTAPHPAAMMSESALRNVTSNEFVGGLIASGAAAAAAASGALPSGMAGFEQAAANGPIASLANPANSNSVDCYAVIYERLGKHMNDLLGDLDFDGNNEQRSGWSVADRPSYLQAVRSIAELLKNAKQNPRDPNVGLSLIKTTVNGLRELIINFQEGSTDLSIIQRVRDFYLLLLKSLTDQRGFTNRFNSTHVTRFVMEQWLTMNNPTFPDDLFDALVRGGLINYQYMDTEFYNILESGQSGSLIPIMLQFLKAHLGTGHSPNSFSQTIEWLNRIYHRMSSGSMQNNTQLLSELRTICMLAQRPEHDLNTFIEKVKIIITEWIQCYNTGKNLTFSFQQLVKHMSIQGLLKNDEAISRFFKIFLELVIENCKEIFITASQHPNILPSDVHLRCFEFIDSFTVLTLLFVKQSGGTTNLEQKFQFLQRILFILSSTCLSKHEAHVQQGKEFHPLVFYRILIIILVEFFYSPYHLGLTEFMMTNDGTPTSATQYESFKISLLKGYAQLLHNLSPLKAPAFAYAWYDLVSHRVFLSKLLESPKTWELYFMILCDMLAFQKALLASDAKNDFYKVTVKLFMLLYHGTPDFLVEYCYHFCTLLPHRAINLRNIILSAVPLNSMLPDPVKMHVKVEALHEIMLPFCNMTTVAELPFRKELDNYLVSRQPANFLNDLRACLTNGGSAPNGEKADKAVAQIVYNVQLLDTMTLYIGLSAIQSIKQITVASVANTPHIEVFQSLFMTFDSQGRYHLLNSMVDHLRYPNNETVLYLCIILSLFNDSTDQLREQIVRVLLERILARLPHPWGVKYLLAELIHNPNYKLLEHNFVKGVPEVEKILVSNFQEVIGPNFEQM